MRKFEADYRLREGDDILTKEDAIHRDLDLRLDAVEAIAEEFRRGNRLDVDALIRNIESTFSHLAAEMRGLLDDTAGGISADTVKETATRVFLTATRRAAILSELRGDVASDGDTLAKLHDALLALPTATAVASAIKAAIDDLKGGASSAYDTLKEIEASIEDDKSAAASVTAALAKRVRFDAAQSLSATESAQARGNIGAAAQADLDGGLGKRVRFDAAQTLSATESAQARSNIGAAAQADLDGGLGKRVRFDAAQTLSATESAQARSNIGAAAKADTDTALAGKLAKDDFTGATLRDKLLQSGAGTSAATAATVASRDAYGRSSFTDCLRRSTGSAIVARDERIGGMRWADSYIEVLIDTTAMGIQTSASDARAKENVETQADRDELAKIARLRFVSFDWRADSPFTGHRALGLIAQEIARIDPDWVLAPVDETGLYQLDLSGLLVSSLRAHQQAAERMQALEARLATLESAHD